MNKKYITAEELITQARTWIGTKFKHQGRLKKTQNHKGGVDCLGFVIGVAKELNLLSGIVNKQGRELYIYELDDLEYSRNSDPVKLLDGFDRYCITIESLDKARAGDLVLMEFENLPKHIGIITNYNDVSGELGLIHSFVRLGGVVEHRLTDEWKSKINKIYRLRRIK